MRPVIVALWLVAQLGTNALFAFAYEPRASFVLLVVLVLATNMLASVAGWELTQGRSVFVRAKKATTPAVTMPRVLFIKRMQDERGEWFAAWEGLANLLNASDRESQSVGVYRLREVTPVAHIMRRLTP